MDLGIEGTYLDAFDLYGYSSGYSNDSWDADCQWQLMSEEVGLNVRHRLHDHFEMISKPTNGAVAFHFDSNGRYQMEWSDVITFLS